jgi:TM2 domain-containing membrane protein YozV
MANVLQFMPQLEGDEMNYVQGLIKDMDDTKAAQFANIYLNRRKDPLHILLFALIGFVAAAGIHRFVLGQIGMGILYLLTGGLCLVGTILDLINHKRLAFDYNYKVAAEVANLIKFNS